MQAREPDPCLPEAEFDAAFSDQVRAGQFAISTTRYGGRTLCSGKTFAQRLQELRRQFFPHEEEERQRAQALRAAADRAEREAYERRLALEQARQDHLASLDYEADIAEARSRKAQAEQFVEEARHRTAVARRRIAEEEARAALARSKKAMAELSQAEAERQLASLPPPVRTGAIRLVPAQPLSGRVTDNTLYSIDTFLRHESGNWPHGARYRANSAYALEAYQPAGQGTDYVVAARFKYTDGSDGWVEIYHDGADITQGRVSRQDEASGHSWFDTGLQTISSFGYDVMTNVVSDWLLRVVTRGKYKG